MPEAISVNSLSIEIKEAITLDDRIRKRGISELVTGGKIIFQERNGILAGSKYLADGRATNKNLEKKCMQQASAWYNACSKKHGSTLSTRSSA